MRPMRFHFFLIAPPPQPHSQFDGSTRETMNGGGWLGESPTSPPPLSRPQFDASDSVGARNVAQLLCDVADRRPILVLENVSAIHDQRSSRSAFFPRRRSSAPKHLVLRLLMKNPAPPNHWIEGRSSRTACGAHNSLLRSVTPPPISRRGGVVGPAGPPSPILKRSEVCSFSQLSGPVRC